jgi:putative inorganic carbon (hco3(-)) transporter
VLHFWVLTYLAAQYVRPGEIFPSMATWPILDVLSGVGLLVFILSLVLKPREFYKEPQDLFLLLFTFAIVISNPLNHWVGGALYSFTNFAPVLFCYVLIRAGIQNYSHLRRFTRLFIALNLFLAINGLMQVYLGYGFAPVEAMDTEEGIRIQGTGIFNDPNDLGMTLVMSVPFLMASALGRGTRFFARLLSALVLATVLLACYWTNSRGTILGIGVVFTAYAYRRYGLAKASVFAMVGLVGILALGPSRMSEMSADEDSAQGRIQSWSEGLQMFKGSPLWGVGYRQYSDYTGIVAHNAFVHVLGELGLLGAIPFVGLFYSFFQGMNRTPSAEMAADPRQLRLRSEISDSALGLITTIMFLSRQYVVVPFVLVAIGACYATATGPRPVPPNGLLHMGIVAALTVVLVIVFYMFVLLFASY